MANCLWSFAPSLHSWLLGIKEMPSPPDALLPAVQETLSLSCQNNTVTMKNKNSQMALLVGETWCQGLSNTIILDALLAQQVGT